MGYSKNNIALLSVPNPSNIFISTHKIRFYIGLATITFFQFILWPTANYSLSHPIEYLIGYFTIVILPTAILASAAIYLVENRSFRHTREELTHRANLKRQATLKNRIQNDGVFSNLQKFGEYLILRFVVPRACLLDRHFGDYRWVHEHMVAVSRRYLALPTSQAMEYPDRKNSYFLHIVDYIWQDDSITFVFEPAIGIVRAKKAIIRRLSQFDKKCSKEASYEQKGTQLHVRIPHKLLI